MSRRTKRQSFLEYVSVKPPDGKTKEIKVSERSLVAKRANSDCMDS